MIPLSHWESDLVISSIQIALSADKSALIIMFLQQGDLQYRLGFYSNKLGFGFSDCLVR